MTAYAELHCATNYSFLRGASHPEELVRAAHALGLSALAITDRNSLAGVVRAHVEAKALGLKLVVGAEVTPRDTPPLLLLPGDRAAYGRLSRLLTLGKRRATKGQCDLDLADLAAHEEGQFVLVPAPERPDDPGFATALGRIAEAFPGRAFLSLSLHLRGDDAVRLAAAKALSARLQVPLVATNAVLMHDPARRPLADVVTCIREHLTVDTAGHLLAANAERHLKSPAAMAALFAAAPEALARTVEIAVACRFSLDELRFDYAIDPVEGGRTPQEEMERLTWEGAAWRYPDGLPEEVERRIRHEFRIIAELGYAAYFLTVHDIVRFARGRGILCQGRGSAANSAVCFCLGITSVDPARADLLFERFVSAARREPPDIDVDFEHERREEVIQYIYAKYGRDRAALAASVTTYRSRSAIREVGKAMGLSVDAVSALAGTVWGSSSEGIPDAHVREAGLDPGDPRLRLALDLAQELKGFPRHLSQHVGGFVLTQGPLTEIVPVENAAMADRTVIEWDKDDLDALGILKVDILALGMLTCVRKAFDLIELHHGRALTLATVPAEDPATYDMLCKGDSLGVFQVESRAQMTMLPRLKPRCFYDLVIEVAIVRPGPIQGDMVHPYLRRRRGDEPVSFPSEALRRVLEKTLGVPLFQEQAMRIAIEAAGFTPEDADRLRRAMATFRRTGTIHGLKGQFLEGMKKNGYDPEFAERCFRQIEGFGEYGFPESHAASFALLVYVSSWLKCHYPAAFACALLNAQPMGFYAPAQIVRDAREHGVEVRPVDVNRSTWDNGLEPGRDGAVALRLGFRQITSLAEADADLLVESRGAGYGSILEVRRRAGLPRDALEALARADAFAGIGLSRRQALWDIKGLEKAPAPPLLLPLFETAAPRPEPPVRLPDLAPGEEVVEDYISLRLTLRQHPVGLLRPTLLAALPKRFQPVPSARLAELPHGAPVAVAGLAVCRQRPGTARGIIFITLEDESGVANLIVRPPVFEAHRPAVLRGRLLVARGRLQKEGLVIHVMVEALRDHTADLFALTPDNAPVPAGVVRADRVPHNPPSPLPPERKGLGFEPRFS